MMVQGLRLALAARDMSAAWDREYEQLLAETQRMEQLAHAELAALNDLAVHYRTAFADRVLPALDLFEKSSTGSDPDTVLQQLAQLTYTYAGTPMFATVAEFDAFMADDSQVLHLLV